MIDKDDLELIPVLACKYAQFYLAKKRNLLIPNVYPPFLGKDLRVSSRRKENLENILYDAYRHGYQEITMSRYIGEKSFHRLNLQEN